MAEATGAAAGPLLDLLAGPTAATVVEPGGLLARTVTAAAQLLNARYAAVGLVGDGPDGHVEVVVHTTGSESEAGEVAVVRAPPASAHLDALLRVAHGERPALPGAPPDAPALVVPVPADDGPLGFLALADPQPPRDFSRLDGETARALAATLGLRLERERESRELRRRSDWLAALLRITSRSVAEDAPDRALREVANLAREVCRADAAWIRVGAAPDDTALVAVSRAPGDETRDESGLPGGLDLVEDEAEDAGEPLTVVVPLRGASGLHGSLTLTWAASRHQDFEAVGPDLPASLAEHVVLALEVARSREDRGRVQVQEERERIARDLHDVVLQDLFASAMGLQALARTTADPESREGLELAAGELRATSRAIRRSIFGLGSGGAGLDLSAEVTRLVQRARRTLKLDVALEVCGPLGTVHPETGADLVAVLAEALSNATQHAGADSVTVRVTADPEERRLQLTVTDDGDGVAADPTLNGLRNLRARAEQHDGTLEVGPRPQGGGTRLVWTVRLAP